MATRDAGGTDPGGGGGEGTGRPPGDSISLSPFSSPSRTDRRRGAGERGLRGSGGLRGGQRPSPLAMARGQGSRSQAPEDMELETSTTQSSTSTTNNLQTHHDTIITPPEHLHDSTFTRNDDRHSTSTPKGEKPKNPETTKPKLPTPPAYTVRGWTLNRTDNKMYNAAGESRVMSSEEWRAIQLLDKQWRNKLERRMKTHKPRPPGTKPNPPKKSRPLAITGTDTRTTQTTNKHKLSSTSNDDTDAKKTKTDDEQEEMQTDQTDWESQSVKHMTIRIQSSKTNAILTQDDIQHINRVMMRSLYAEAKGDFEKWRKLQPDKMSLVHPNHCIRLRLTSEEGIEFWKSFVPTIPPRMEGGDKYIFLAPGESLTEKVCFFVPDASFGEGKDVDLELLTFVIKAGNPLLEKVDFTLRTMGIDSNTLQSVMIMELQTADRERCLGPKPENPADRTDWKIKIGLSNVNVKVAFAKSDVRRQENAQARLNKKATDKINDDPLESQDEDVNLDKEDIDKLLSIDADILTSETIQETEIEVPGITKMTGASSPTIDE